MRSLYWVGFLCVLSLACRPSASGPPAARTPVADLEATTIPQAFEQLARDTFRLTRTLVVLDSSGQLLGREVRTGLYRPDSALRWLRIDQNGTFPEGPFDHAISRADRTPLAATQALWPEPLPFLQPRQRDAYRFRSLPDTVLFGQTVARLHVRPADPERTGPEAFQGMLYLDARRLIGAVLQETHATLFGTERRFLSVGLHPDDGRLLREQLLLELDPPGRPPYRFCLETRYIYGTQAPADPPSHLPAFCRHAPEDLMALKPDDR